MFNIKPNRIHTAWILSFATNYTELGHLEKYYDQLSILKKASVGGCECDRNNLKTKAKIIRV